MLLGADAARGDVHARGAAREGREGGTPLSKITRKNCLLELFTRLRAVTCAPLVPYSRSITRPDRVNTRAQTSYETRRETLINLTYLRAWLQSAAPRNDDSASRRFDFR